MKSYFLYRIRCNGRQPACWPFLQLIVIKHLQKAGHVPILLLGTGTTMVGDPTGKTDMRKMMTVDEINYNADQFLKQMSKFVDITPERQSLPATVTG